MRCRDDLPRGIGAALNVALVAIGIVAVTYLLTSRRLSQSSTWRATLTPLASIMGSGFLVSAPLLAATVGLYALPAMAVLLVLAYGVGSAVRFNIRHFEPIEHEQGPAQITAFVSRIALAVAYFVSVTYYLQLLAAFLLNIVDIREPGLGRWVTTAMLSVIGGLGIWRGLGMLERMERYAVSINLGIITALLVGLAVHNGELLSGGSWHLPDVESVIDGHAARVVLGLLIVVQGFETSRYLGGTHPAEERVRTMRLAQLLSAAVYLVFIALATVLFDTTAGADVTAVIQMSAPVAAVLPVLITVAAVGSQFSAAVADTAGAGGLIEEITSRRCSLKFAYGIILVATLVLTWETDVTEIIAYASRAFALFYALQATVAFLVARSKPELPRRGLQLTMFAVLIVLCAAVFVLGIPAE